MIEQSIRDFKTLLISDRISGVNTHEREITQLFLNITELLGQDYQTYYRYFPDFVTLLDEHSILAVSYCLKNFENIYQAFQREISISPLDLSLIELPTDTSIAERANQELRRVLKKNKPISISDEPFNFDHFTKCEKELAAAAYIHALESMIENPRWDNKDFETTNMLLLPLHQLLKEIGQPEMFYHNVGSLLDRYVNAENFQPSRNLMEEVIKTAFKDSTQDLGFLVAFRVFALGHNPTATLTCGCISMMQSMLRGNDISERHFAQLYTQAIKLFRNINVLFLATKFYESRPQHLVLSAYEKRSLDNIYFSSLLKQQDERLPYLILDYLNGEREVIFASGKRESIPWLILLLQIKNRYPKGDYSSTGLGFYLQVFESIVPPEDIRKYRTLIFADNDDIKKLLKESIVKLNATFYESDFVYDNERALLNSNRCMVYAHNQKEASAFLLAMVLKSDFSLLFKGKEVPKSIHFHIPETDLTELNATYDNAEKLVAQLPGSDEGFTWIGLADKEFYQMHYIAGQFGFHVPENWDVEKFAKVRNIGYFTNLSFNETIKENKQVRVLSRKEHIEQGWQIISNLQFAKLSIPKQATALHLVKDMELSFFPHNLFLDQHGELISERLPVTNVLSTEWIRFRKKGGLISSFSKAIWIPTESEDGTILMLYLYLEEILTKNKVVATQAIRPEHPLTSQLNIVCAHGADDISELQIFHFKDKLTLNLDALVGPGKILILWVCHSGSAMKPLFRNETANLVKRFIEQGYEAVIAPAWSLNIKIPPIWLPEFLSKMEQGETVSKAVFGANQKVREIYPTPAAWANLHLYGNPNVSIELLADGSV